MAKALNSMPLNIVQELFMNGHTRDEALTYIGLVTSTYATPSGIFAIELSQVRTCTCGLSVEDTRRVLRSLEEADLLTYDGGVMFLPLAATARNWASFQFREKHMVAVYDAFSDPGTNRAFKKWAERNPATEKVELARKSGAQSKTARGFQPAQPTIGAPTEQFRAPKIGGSSPHNGGSSPHKDSSSPHSSIPSEGIERVSEGIGRVSNTTDKATNSHRSPSEPPLLGIGIGIGNGSREYTGGVWGGDSPHDTLRGLEGDERQGAFG